MIACSDSAIAAVREVTARITVIPGALGCKTSLSPSERTHHRAAEDIAKTLNPERVFALSVSPP
jgi:hypothetical protein